jgi:hypothetical protein
MRGQLIMPLTAEDFWSRKPRLPAFDIWHSVRESWMAGQIATELQALHETDRSLRDE